VRVGPWHPQSAVRCPSDTQPVNTGKHTVGTLDVEEESGS
jgi:hypothetical protein